VSDFEHAMYDLLIEVLMLRAACVHGGGEVPDYLGSLMEALDRVELAAPLALFSATNDIKEVVERVLGRADLDA
jgi:hypothetical protein